MNHVKSHRRSIRLKGYDYSQIGMYFITICAQNRKCLFGEIVNGKMILNATGKYADKCWNDIPLHFPHAKLDMYCIMPNHIHGIVNITEPVGAKNFLPLQANTYESIGSISGETKNLTPPNTRKPNGTSKTIGSMIRGFKIGVTKWLRNNTPKQKIWQRNYYEHIVRDENDYRRLCEYIENNPLKWEEDSLNPINGDKFWKN